MDFRPCPAVPFTGRLGAELNHQVEAAMRALVYHGPGRKSWDEVPDPQITDDGDIIVQVDATTICSTDLHILNGDLAEVRSGRILGHEAVGTVDEAGDGIRTL